MKLTSETLKQLCFIAIETAKAAGELIESYDTSKLEVERKKTGDTLRSQVVTKVDRQSEKLILKSLQKSREEYDLGLLTEEREDDGSRFQKDNFWCLDPLDGTLCFIEDHTGYAVSIALLSREGDALIGVVYNPREKQLFHAFKGGGAFLNGEPLFLKACKTDSPKVIEAGGAVMNACKVLIEAPAIFTKKPKTAQGGGCLWDYAATACIYTELGAWVSDYAGNPLHLNSKESLFLNHCGVFFASTPEIAKEYLFRL